MVLELDETYIPTRYPNQFADSETPPSNILINDNAVRNTKEIINYLWCEGCKNDKQYF